MSDGPPAEAPLWLASRSPRRQSLLAEVGVGAIVRPAGIDDGTLIRGAVGPAQWVMALAYLKARWVADVLVAEHERVGTVLGADTVCVQQGRVLGQPPTGAAARAMLVMLRDATHETMTGVCLMSLRDGRRWMFVDRARVTCGGLDDAMVDAYVASGSWRGKAGGYNLTEQIEAGWPLECAGDPATVMGLPLRRLESWLAGFREDGP